MKKYYSKRATKLITDTYIQMTLRFLNSPAFVFLFLFSSFVFIPFAFLLPPRRDLWELITILDCWDSALVRCQHDNGLAIDLMFDPFDWQPMYAMLYGWFPKPILVNQLLMHCHPFDCDHIQYCNCFCAEISAREYPPTKNVNNQWIFIAGTFFQVVIIVFAEG